jgi:hypothetical protein
MVVETIIAAAGVGSLIGLLRGRKKPRYRRKSTTVKRHIRRYR